MEVINVTYIFPRKIYSNLFIYFFFLYIQKIKVTTHNKFEIKILTHGQIRTLNQTIQNNRYQSRTPQGTMWYRQSPGPTKNKNKLNKHKHCQFINFDIVETNIPP